MKDSLEKFLRAIGGLIEDDASIRNIRADHRTLQKFYRIRARF